MSKLNLQNGFSLISGAQSVACVYAEVDGGFQEMSHNNEQMVMLLGGDAPRALFGKDAADAIYADATLRMGRVHQLRSAWANLKAGDIEMTMKATGHGPFPFQEMVSGMNFLSAVSRGSEWTPRRFTVEIPAAEGSVSKQIEQMDLWDESEDEEDPFAGMPEVRLDEQRHALGARIKAFEPHVATTAELLPSYEILKAMFDERAETASIVESFAALVKAHFESVTNRLLGPQ